MFIMRHPMQFLKEHEKWKLGEQIYEGGVFLTGSGEMVSSIILTLLVVPILSQWFSKKERFQVEG